MINPVSKGLILSFFVQRSLYLVERDERERQRRRLRGLLNDVLDAHHDLSYYQVALLLCRSLERPSRFFWKGFHDVASTIMLVCKKTGVSRCVLDRLATGPLRPLLAPDLSLATGLLGQLFPIVREEDEALHAFLLAAGVQVKWQKKRAVTTDFLVAQPYFALPWVLTWFSHSVSSFAMVQRMFDLFLACGDPAMPFFVSVAVVLWAKPHLNQVEVRSFCSSMLYFTAASHSASTARCILSSQSCCQTFLSR